MRRNKGTAEVPNVEYPDSWADIPDAVSEDTPEKIGTNDEIQDDESGQGNG